MLSWQLPSIEQALEIFSDEAISEIRSVATSEIKNVSKLYHFVAIGWK
jgi:hypothetical protein